MICIKNNHTEGCGYFGNGGGGSRTPVRKRFNKNFSGRRRLFTFPHPGVSRHTQRLGSFMIHGTRKALRTHVHHSTTPHPGPWSFRAGRPLIKQRRERRYRCSFIYKLPILRMLGASARYSGLHVPVETSTPPRRRKVRSVQDTLMGILHAAPLLLLFPSDPLRWALMGFLRGFCRKVRSAANFTGVLSHPPAEGSRSAGGLQTTLFTPSWGRDSPPRRSPPSRISSAGRSWACRSSRSGY